MAKWNFRIVKIEYTDGVGYGVETDKGIANGQWYSVFKSDNLDKVREVKAERESKQGSVQSVTVID